VIFVEYSCRKADLNKMTFEKYGGIQLSMKKSELVARVAEKSGITFRESNRVVNAVLDTIKESLAEGDKVRITGFGTFEVRKRSARKGRNPQTGEILNIPAARVPVFKPGKAVKKVAVRMERRCRGLPRVIAVTSGKGGTGKTNFVINCAIALAQQNLKVYIIDADLGTANVDVLLGINSKYTIQHLVDKTKDSILDIVVDGPEGIKIIPGGSGLQSLTELTEEELNRVISMFEPLEEHADVILIDTGSGISRNVVNFLTAADEIVVIITPEPHSITDAYAIIKVLNERGAKQPIKMVFNMVDNVEEAKDVARRMLKVIGRFLDVKPEPLWYIVRDDAVGKAIKNFRPLLTYSPSSPAAKCLVSAAQKLNPLLNVPTPNLMEEKEPRGFVAKLKSFFTK